jgi:hypothetical protein
MRTTCQCPCPSSLGPGHRRIAHSTRQLHFRNSFDSSPVEGRMNSGTLLRVPIQRKRVLDYCIRPTCSMNPPQAIPKSRGDSALKVGDCCALPTICEYRFKSNHARNTWNTIECRSWYIPSCSQKRILSFRLILLV